ncbi:hypothetical protein [Paenibacillus curdlanolyticus]|nr:hypothetical protein [Paenibacillus curdlanolyticus]
MTVDEFHTYFVSELGIWVHNTNSGINNVRVMQDTKIKGYTVSMDVERGGSGLVNVHVKVNNTKYFYDAETSQFLDGTGNRLPNSLRGNEQINNALKKAQKYVKSWCFNINMTKEKNNKKSKYQEIKYIKYNQDDILEILTEALAKENGFGTFYSKAMLLGTLGKDLRLIAVIGELEDDEKIELINLNELDENMNYNGTHK